MTRTPYLNSLEPPQLYDAFIANPPVGFVARQIDAGGGFLPVFVTPFDLFTTLDEDVKKRVAQIPLVRSIARALLRPRAIFCGTTVSEYAVYHATHDPGDFARSLLAEMKSSGAKLAIFKDLPK